MIFSLNENISILKCGKLHVFDMVDEIMEL